MDRREKLSDPSDNLFCMVCVQYTTTCIIVLLCTLLLIGKASELTRKDSP